MQILKLREIFIIVLMFIATIARADELHTIEKAANIVQNRLEQGLFFTPITDEQSFEEQAGKQIQFAIMSLNAHELLTEDWFDLLLYCIARKYRYYNLALRLLRKEYEMEEYPQLRRWINHRIKMLEKNSFSESAFDIRAELYDLRKRCWH